MLKILVLPIMMFFQTAHLTMTSIEQIQGTDSIKVLVRLDYDLFLRDYQQAINDDLDLNNLRSYEVLPADLINNYINSKVFIRVNRELLTGKLLNTKAVDGEISLLIHYRLRKHPKNITVRNTFLTGLFSDVANLTIIKIGNFETGIKFTQEHPEETFLLE